jgi:hypothetical protein
VFLLVASGVVCLDRELPSKSEGGLKTYVSSDCRRQVFGQREQENIARRSGCKGGSLELGPRIGSFSKLRTWGEVKSIGTAEVSIFWEAEALCGLSKLSGVLESFCEVEEPPGGLHGG